MPPMVTSVVGTNVVASFAPVRHGSLKGTSSPKTLRPFIEGTLYSTVMVLPSENLQTTAGAGGLGRFDLSSGGFCANARLAVMRIRTSTSERRIRFLQMHTSLQSRHVSIRRAA